MDEKLVDVQAIDYRRAFPWVHLFRAFRIAVDFRKIVLAGLALELLRWGAWVFARLPFAPEEARAAEITGIPWPETSEVWGWIQSPQVWRTDPGGTLLAVATRWEIVLSPLGTFFGPMRVLFEVGSSWSELAFAWTHVLWALIVWALLGGAITRMAAVQFARDEKLGLLTALRFSGRKFLSFVSAPLLPLVGIGVLWLLCYLGGLFARIPVAGEVIVGVLWIIPLLLGFVMALILIGLAVGWPLMFATISTEASDGFDGFSRSYSYIYNRPWNFLWLILVALVYGSLVIFFVSVVVSLVVYLAGWGVASGMGVESIGDIYQQAGLRAGGADVVVTNSIAAFSGVWLHVVAVLLDGFTYSYFWTASTIIYFLLRRAEDATDLDEVFMTAEEAHDELLPLVGVAASEQPAIERPHELENPTESSPEPSSESSDAPSAEGGTASTEDAPTGDEDSPPPKD